MHAVLNGKKFIFFDIGYTLDMPASGDWVFTNRFYTLAGDRLKAKTASEIRRARERGMDILMHSGRLSGVSDEIRVFCEYYAAISDELGLGFSAEDAYDISRDRAENMANYVPYPDIRPVLSALAKELGLGVISDTWPSIDAQLEHLGISGFFSAFTYSFNVGVFKPDSRMYLDALSKCGFEAKDTVFIDDSVENLRGAAALGITPILIAANPASDVPTEYTKIYSLTELL